MGYAPGSEAQARARCSLRRASWHVPSCTPSPLWCVRAPGPDTAAALPTVTPSTPAQALVAPYKADPGTKAARRAVDKALTLGVQQVSASREQVSRLSLRLGRLMTEQAPGPASAYAQLALASKICVQCEVQVTRLPGFAFPLAEVAVAVAAALPAFAELLIAQLVAACPLCLPGAYERPGAGASEEAWLRLTGYKVRTDEDSGQVRPLVWAAMVAAGFLPLGWGMQVRARPLRVP